MFTDKTTQDNSTELFILIYQIYIEDSFVVVQFLSYNAQIYKIGSNWYSFRTVKQKCHAFPTIHFKLANFTQILVKKRKTKNTLRKRTKNRNIKCEKISYIFKKMNLLSLKTWINNIINAGFIMKKLFTFVLTSKLVQPHQWHSGNAQNWKTGGAWFKPRSRLSTQPFGVFRGFLRNSLKYGLGSHRKTSTEGTPPTGLGPSEKISLKTNNQPTNQSKLALRKLNFYIS